MPGKPQLVKDNTGTLRIVDADAFERGGNSITLRVQHSTLYTTAVQGAGLVGNGTQELAIAGAIKQINQMLGKLKYLPDRSYNGSDAIKVFYSGNAKSGDPSVKDANNPLFPGGNWREDGSLVHNGLYLKDSDKTNKDDGTIKKGLVRYGVIDLTITPVNDAPSGGARVLILSGSLADVNTTLKTIRKTVQYDKNDWRDTVDHLVMTASGSLR